jgi:deoxyguanosine kinase
MCDSISNCASAVVHICKNIGAIQAMSHVYQSSSWGFDSKNGFINIVVWVKTTLSALEVLNELQSVESLLQKTVSPAAYHNRMIDADILFYENEVYVDKQLCIPHPLLHLRHFCLRPLSDIASHLIHPVLKLSVKDMCSQTDQQESISLNMNSVEFELIVKDHEYSV